jgi:cytochrome P450
MKIRNWRPSLRWIAKYFIPEIRRIYSHNATAIALIGNVLKERSRDEQDEGYDKPVDALQWVKDALPAKKQKDIRFQTLISLALVAAAINTTSQLLTNTIFDLAVRPEYIDMLREEATEVLNGSNGQWTADAVSKLKKMDSFVKESQRQNSIVSKSQPFGPSSILCTDSSIC